MSNLSDLGCQLSVNSCQPPVSDVEDHSRRAGSIPADVSAAIVVLHTSLSVLSEFTDPKVSELASKATRAAITVVDALQGFAADLADVTR